nr:spermidine/putrescine ABC transporter ATP-binding protein [Bacillus mobilis]
MFLLYKISLFIWFYPALTDSKLPPQNSGGAKKLGGRSTVRKRPIGEG